MLNRIIGPVLLAILTAGAAAAQARTTRSAHVAFSRLWTASTGPNADSTPAYINNVRLPNGKHAAMLYVLGGNNGSNCNPGEPVTRSVLSALDAKTGKVRWRRGTSGPSRCTTAAPVADPSGRWVYAAGLDGQVHRYAAGSGRETSGHGWPHRVTLMPDVEKMASSLTIGSGHLYVTTSGFIGDQGHYEGHLVTINLSNGTGHVFNSLCSNVHRLLGPDAGASNYCSDEKSGLFGRGQGVTDPVNHDVYVVSGNGPWNGRTNWGDSILRLDPSGARLLDSYTPANQSDLEASDEDLGSTGPALLPPFHDAGRTYHLLIQGGKGPACGTCKGTGIHLLDRDNLSGHGGPGHLGGGLATGVAPGGCEILTAPAVWTSGSHRTLAIYSNDCGTVAYRVQRRGGRFKLLRAWSIGTGGTTPVVHSGVLYVARNHALTAYDPANGSSLGTAAIGPVHWEYPLAVDGRIYITDDGGRVTAFKPKRT